MAFGYTFSPVVLFACIAIALQKSERVAQRRGEALTLSDGWWLDAVLR